MTTTYKTTTILKEGKQIQVSDGILNSKEMFTIFKEGVTTEGPVTILAKIGEPFDIDLKVAKYKMLGYSVVIL